MCRCVLCSGKQLECAVPHQSRAALSLSEMTSRLAAASQSTCPAQSRIPPPGAVGCVPKLTADPFYLNTGFCKK